MFLNTESELIMLVDQIAVNALPVTTTVLLKDTESKSLVFDATQTLANIEAERVTWEQGAYRTSNQALYAVLANCLAYCGKLTMDEAIQRSAALKAFYKERGYTYKQDLPLATRVVRAVFGARDRRRISTYSLVIRQAQKESVEIANLPKWIEERGGVQEISLGRSATYVTAKNKAELARGIMQYKSPLGFAQSELLSIAADADRVGEDCVLLAKQHADGSFAVHAVLRQEGLINAAFTALYSVQKEKLKQAQAEVDAANDADGAEAKSA